MVTTPPTAPLRVSARQRIARSARARARASCPPVRAAWAGLAAGVAVWGAPCAAACRAFRGVVGNPQKVIRKGAWKGSDPSPPPHVVLRRRQMVVMAMAALGNGGEWWQ